MSVKDMPRWVKRPQRERGCEQCEDLEAKVERMQQRWNDLSAVLEQAAKLNAAAWGKKQNDGKEQ